ncbi:MAG TPA: hypothetical protein VE131_03625 [Terriglobales bacterium]|nr:hypothetical protein [Terriglobales bacterium]
MGRIGKKLEDLFSAASFAEEGEPETARQFLEGRKKVVLVLTGRPSDVKPLKHALNLALRNDADIEALIVTPDKQAADSASDFLRAEIKNMPVDVSVSRKSGCIKESIITHTRKRGDVLCVVAESEEILEIDCPRRHRKLEGVWRELGCPLTLVSQKGGA